ncbi:MAG: DUF4390 domain-containing protein [Zoogloeaceae bacterium]|jgi:hypothetical protein|nr:DUF4390 domain-containing protein [Zoogloeaceae bacterium]
MRRPENRCLFALLLLALLFGAPTARAEGASLQNLQLTPVEEGGYALSARIGLDFNERLADAVARGITLYFVLEFELHRPRWYWTDTVIARKRRVWRLAYHALTRQYRLSTGELHQSFATQEEALQQLVRVAQWPVVETALPADETLEARARFFLDRSQLPKPFQFSAMTSGEWEVDSGWQRWKFVSGSPSGVQGALSVPEPP